MDRSKLTTLLCLVLCIISCTSCSLSSRQTQRPSITAILGAFDKEVTLLEDLLTERQESEIEGIRFVSGRLCGQRVVIAWTGIGKVNAAMSATLVLEHFKPRRVIFTGIAGAVNPQLRAGDIVIAQKVAHHDMGTLWPDGLQYLGVKNRLTGWENPVFFESDGGLLSLAEDAAGRVKLSAINTVDGARTPRIIKGVVVTGDVFVASPKKCQELRNSLGADAVEMEGAAVAQVCYQRQVPFVVIRSISDSADEGAMVDKQMFYIMAAENSSRLVREIVGIMGTECSANNHVGTPGKTGD
jgi:adenosylhomocysteine nucleosidase